MKRILWVLAIALLLLQLSAFGAPLCTDQTVTGVGGSHLDSYISLGAGGCMLNGLLFYNFAYSYTLGTDGFYTTGPKGTGASQPAGNVLVTVDGINTAFSFGAQWFIDRFQTENLSLSYNVSAPSKLIDMLINTFTSTQTGTQNGGPIKNEIADCSGATCGGSTTFTNNTVPITGTNGVLLITNSVVANANGSTVTSPNQYHLSIIKDQFDTTQGSQVPEPITPLMAATGLAAIAYWRRR